MPKKYSLYIEKNRITGLEIDGTRYRELEQISDPQERAGMAALVAGWEDRDLYSAGQSGPGFSLMIPLLFLGVAVLMLAIFAFSALRAIQAGAREVQAAGRVIEMVERPDQNGRAFYYPLVQFTLPGGSVQITQVSEGSWPPAYQVGERVTVAYDPQQPDEARILSVNSSLGRWTLALISGILAAAFLAAAGFSYWVVRA